MNPDDLSWAFLFLVIVALIIIVGVLVGMIVGGRIDRLQAPRPPRMSDDDAVASSVADPSAPPPHEPIQEDQQP